MKNHGGPAFPQNDAGVNRINNHDGMSLLDWYRGKALQGVCANPDLVRALCERSGNPALSAQTIADIALLAAKLADAMLMERDK